jgi:hypothetical protein
MKYLKMLGLAAIAAMGLMAFVGASVASAAIYTDAAKTSKYPVGPPGTGTTISASLASGKSAVLKSGSTVIATCTGGGVHGVAENEDVLGTVSGTIKKEDLTWTGCSQTTHTVSDGKLFIESDGDAISTGSQVTLGILGTSCTYGTGEGIKLGTVTSGSPAVLKINANIPRTAGGFLCPSTGTWEAEYVVTSPHALYVG